MKTLLLASAVAGALGVFAAPAFAHEYDRGYGDSYYQHGRYDDHYGERYRHHRHFWRGWDRHHERDWFYRNERRDSWHVWHRHERDWRY